jgi:HEAT repeat-containing protein 5
MLTLLVPILISFLLETNQQKTSTKFCMQLHEQSLQWLMKVGPKYPQVCSVTSIINFSIKINVSFQQEFKTLMGQAPELRNKLESAVRNQQQAATLQKTAMETAENENKTVVQSQQPSIKLKTKFDFS